MPLKKVFLCHSSGDKVFVDRLASDLEKVNIGVWYDKWEIKVGDSLIEKIQEGLDKNDYLAIILSPESVISEWVKRELNSALMKEVKDKKVVVLPCLLRNCSIPSFLSDKKYADFRISYEDGFTNLLLAIFPESKESVIHSRDFRVVQYLISGLTNTDSFGSNILNACQLTKIFPFRKELKEYLGLDEKKLLFYSAVAFKSANPDTPIFINNNVPVWCLLNEVEDFIKAQWLVEGTNQKIFGYMARYFDWAIEINKSIKPERIKDAFINASESLDPNHYNTIHQEQTRVHLLKFFAKYDPEFFMDGFIKKGIVDPGIIEATAEFSDPLDIDYYLHIYQDSKESVLVSSTIKALIKLKEPISVQILSENYPDNRHSWNHEIMNLFRANEFGTALKSWLHQCSDIDIKVDILGALGNCNVNISDELYKVIDNYKNKNIYTNLVALTRIIGCYGNDSHTEFLISKFGGKDNVLNEVIIYAIGRLLKEKSINYLLNWYRSQNSNLIRAAAIETIARFDTSFINNELDNIFNYKDKLYMLSAFIRAMEISKTIRWKELLPQLFDHSSWLIRLCAARSASVMADHEYSMGILNGNYDNIVKSVFDESLYCREPFKPNWLRNPYNFDIELARLSFRLTWPDQPKVYLQRNLDMDRFISKELLHNEY